MSWKQFIVMAMTILAVAGISATHLQAQCGGEPGCDSTQWYWAVHSGIPIPCAGPDCTLDDWFSYRVVTCPGQPPHYEMRLDSIKFNTMHPGDCEGICFDNLTQLMAIAVDGLLRNGPHAIHLHSPWLNWPPTGPGPCTTQTTVGTAFCWRKFYYTANGHLDYDKMTGCAPDACCTKTFLVCYNNSETCSYTYIGAKIDPSPGPSACTDFNINECIYTCDYAPLLTFGKRTVPASPYAALAAATHAAYTNDAIVIDGTLQRAGQADVAVFDINGRRVAQASAMASASGAYQVRVDARGWTSGTYFYVIRSGGRDLTSGQVGIVR